MKGCIKVKVEQIVKIWNETMDNLFSFKSPVNCQDIADWLIWTDGVCYPECEAPMYVKMNMIAIDYVMEGAY